MSAMYSGALRDSSIVSMCIVQMGLRKGRKGRRKGRDKVRKERKVGEENDN
jgi:hypothetical protein